MSTLGFRRYTSKLSRNFLNGSNRAAASGAATAELQFSEQLQPSCYKWSCQEENPRKASENGGQATPSSRPSRPVPRLSRRLVPSSLTMDIISRHDAPVKRRL